MNVGELIPIIAIVLGIGFAITVVISRHRRDVHELELRHRERMAPIEKGLDLPPESGSARPAVEFRSNRVGGSRYLLRGLVWLGIGLAVALSETHPTENLHSFGWIAVGIGAAYLIYYFVEGRKAIPPPTDGGPPRGDGRSLP